MSYVENRVLGSNKVKNDRQTKEDEKKLKYYTATQWQLISWRFKKHKLSLIGMGILSVFVIISIFPEFIAPYSSVQRNTNYIMGPPQTLKFRNSKWFFYIFSPYIWMLQSERNTESLEIEYIQIPEKAKPVKIIRKR